MLGEGRKTQNVLIFVLMTEPNKNKTITIVNQYVVVIMRRTITQVVLKLFQMNVLLSQNDVAGQDRTG